MNKALLIIDVQNDYFSNGKCELHQPESALVAIKRLLFYFREQHLPVFYIQHIADQNASFFVENTQGVKLHPDLVPLDTEKVIVKHYPDSFLKTALQNELNKADISELVICGMMSHMCIDTTVRTASSLGYTITLISDACATKDLTWKNEVIPAKVVQNVYMASLNQKFASVLNCQEYFNTL